MEPSAFGDKSLSEFTAKQITDYIISEKLRPGDRLPNETELGRALGVGRSTIREAEKILVSRNIIRIQRGRGTFVAQNPGVTDDPLGFQFIHDKVRLLLELLQLRAIIEPSLAELAALNAAAAEIARLEKLEAHIEQAYRAGRDYSTFDVRFHTALARCSHNGVVDMIFPLLIQAVPMTVQYTHGTLTDETLKAHTGIIDAVRRRDSAAARQIMAEHIRQNIELVRSMYHR